MTASSRHVIVEGRVQGVAFRWATRTRALELGLCGWVRNRMDGSVEAHIEGPEASLEPMLEWLRRGPRMASVRSLQASPSEPQGFTDFEIQETVH